MIQIDLKRVREAVAILQNGGIVVYPTETVYGIGCDPLNREACGKVNRLKKRNQSKPFILLADSLKTVEKFAGHIDTVTRKLAGEFWPGPLTMIIRPVQSLPGHLYGPSGGVAFRVTSCPVAAILSREFGQPVISTSANITGSKPVIRYKDAVNTFGKLADIILENTEKPEGKPSTVIDLTSSEPEILRIGSISEKHLQEVL